MALDLLNCFKLASWQQEFFHFRALLRVELHLIENFIEKSLDDLYPACYKLFVLDDGDFGLHEGKDIVFGEGRKDKATVFFGKDLKYHGEIGVPSLNQAERLASFQDLKLIELVL